MRLSRDRFRWSFAACVVAAALLRIVCVLVVKLGDEPVGDELYYSAQAAVIANGDGFAYPFPPGGFAADHAPLTAAALAPVSWSDSDPVLPQRLLMALYGTAVVAGVGLLARFLFGRRVAVVAAALAAVYGAFWLNDVVMMSETFATAGVLAILGAGYAYGERPTPRRAAVMGAAIGVAGLARAELLVLGAAVAAVMIVASRAVGRRRVAHLALAGAVSVMVIAPWVIRNQIRFEESTLISTQDGLTVLGANCPGSYRGDFKGFWAIECTELVDVPEGADQSVQSALYREYGFDYIGAHLDEVPGVVAARLGRGLSVWRVDQMTEINTTEGRARWASWVATVQFWLLAPLAFAGLRMWPSSRPRWPVVTAIGFAVLTLALVYGIPRFRVAGEIGVVLGAAVAIEHLLTARRNAS